MGIEVHAGWDADVRKEGPFDLPTNLNLLRAPPGSGVFPFCTKWEYCRDPSDPILWQVVTIGHVIGRLSRTNSLLEKLASRKKVILRTGLQTPTDVFTEASQSQSQSSLKYYRYSNYRFQLKYLQY